MRPVIGIHHAACRVSVQRRPKDLLGTRDTRLRHRDGVVDVVRSVLHDSRLRAVQDGVLQHQLHRLGAVESARHDVEEASRKLRHGTGDPPILRHLQQHAAIILELLEVGIARSIGVGARDRRLAGEAQVGRCGRGFGNQAIDGPGQPRRHKREVGRGTNQERRVGLVADLRPGEWRRLGLIQRRQRNRLAKAEGPRGGETGDRRWGNREEAALLEGGIECGDAVAEEVVGVEEIHPPRRVINRVVLPLDQLAATHRQMFAPFGDLESIERDAAAIRTAGGIKGQVQLELRRRTLGKQQVFRRHIHRVVAFT